MNLADQIIRSENKYLHKLEDFFNEKWGDTKLWSHDLSHHQRVWNNAKELLLNSDNHDISKHETFCDKLIIVCYLHDLGMSVDSGTRHGFQSMKLCEQFLIKNDLNNSDYQDVLTAIEYHDIKDYKNSPDNDPLLLFLSVADDLDAFGHIGILRYADIYLKRGIALEDLGNKVLENAGKRFENFETNFHKYPALIQKHRNRYLVISEFYTAYNQQ